MKMKRLLTLVLMAAVVLMAVPAFATVAGSPHDYIGTTFGRCGICHVPHAALGTKRLWRINQGTPVGSGWDLANVGLLCGTCHRGGSLDATGNAVGMFAHNVGATAFAATSHGRAIATLGTLGGAAGSQPYMTTSMDCTSCHNVHFEGTFASTATARPFLRGASITSTSVFCTTCHIDRYNPAGLGASNTANGGNNHPVNIAYNGVNATLKAISVMPANMTKPVSAGAWSLGGKFEGVLTTVPADGSTPNIGCQTCHAVHNPATSVDQGNHLLAVDNVAASAALCVGCHGNATGNVARANSNAQMEVGSALGDHPIDCAIVAPGPTIDRWFMVAGGTTRSERHATNYGAEAGAVNAWPRGTAGNIICTSCHSAHRGQSGHKLIRTGWANSGTVGWCTACHSDPSPAGHHTHSGNTGGTLSAVASLLDCAMCHGGGGFSGAGVGSLAHNGFNFNSNFANGVAVNNASQLCNTCHLGEVTGINNANDPLYRIAALPADHLSASINSALKSHYLGSFTNAGNSINVKKSSWSASFSSFSKYGAATDTHGAVTDTTGTTLICESCHSVLHNAGTGASATQTSGYMVNLLLENYQDDGHGTKLPTANTAVGSGLCIACHNNNAALNTANGPVADTALVGTVAGVNANVPAGTHPMTNWSITRAQDAGRAKTALATTAADGTYAAATGAPNAGSYPDTDKMDCDSCHRPHQAPTNSTFNQTKAGGAGNSRPVILERQDTANQWADLCQECHAM